ncbi:MAG: hypothetical protein R2729_26770 [Bryobacteraceae bacterium]
MRRVFDHPVLIAEQALGFAAIGGVFWWWLGFPESGTAALLLSIAALVLMIAGVVALVRRARAKLAGAPANGSDGIVSLMLLIAALAAAYYLVWWVPDLTGFGAQAVSMAIRWGVAYLAVLLAWLNLLGATSPGPRTA